MMTKVKYIRISHISQNTSRQEINANEFSKVYIEKASGAIKFTERPEAMKLLNDIENGTITEIHIASLDRLGRNILDLLTMIEYFNSKSINLFVENIGMYSMIDGKPNPTFKMIASVLGNVAEMERDNMLERQKAGIELAKLQGKYKGRLYGSRMTDEEFLKKYKKVAQELEDGESLRRAARLGSCSLGVAQRVKRIIMVASS
jgi:DNA invertase Pin-like site-specific DNA recombinase